MPHVTGRKPYLECYPDAHGYFGDYGGVHYPDELKGELSSLAEAYAQVSATKAFQEELSAARRHLQGRPTPVQRLANLSAQVGGATLFAKREDLNHTGAHKLNHCVGLALLARAMGKTKLIAETGAGQHGVAVATAAAHYGLACEVHIGETSLQAAHSNVNRMRILGAEVVTVRAGQSALKEASDSAYAAYREQHRHAIYAIGSAIGPHPFPLMVRDFQAVVGQEARRQFMELTDGALPNDVVACVAGGSNAMGLFAGFLDDPDVCLHGAEPLGQSSDAGRHAATLTYGVPGTLHGARCLVLQDAHGRTSDVSSIAAGLIYPGVGPEISMLRETGRLNPAAITDDAAVAAFVQLSRVEGIVPALESAHAVALAIELARGRPSTDRILVNLSGRGDKDVDFVVRAYADRLLG